MPGWLLTFIGGGGLSALVTALVMLRKFPKESRKLDAQRDEIMQDLGRKNAEAATHVVDLVKDEIAELSKERSALRDRALSAEAAEAKAKAETAQAVADLAVEKALRSQERHDLSNELGARDTEIALLRSEVAQLRERLAAFMAQQGFIERRTEETA